MNNNIMQLYELSLINFGLEPNIKNAERFGMKRVYDHLKSHKDVIFFQGIEILSYINQENYMISTLNEPYLLTNKAFNKNKNDLMAIPLSTNFKQHYNLIKFQLDKIKTISNFPTSYSSLQIKTNKSYLDIRPNFNSNNLNLQILLCKDIPKSEIHKKLFNKIRDIYYLKLNDYYYKNEDKEKLETQELTTINNEKIKISIYRRNKNSDLLENIFIETQNPKKISYLKYKLNQNNGLHFDEGKKKITIKALSGNSKSKN